jgi:hypothetical protein
VKLKKDGTVHVIAWVEKDGSMKFEDFGTAQRGEVVWVSQKRVFCFLSRATKNPYGKLVADEDMMPPLREEKVIQDSLF